MRTPVLTGLVAALVLLSGCAAAGGAPSASVPATTVASSSAPAASDQSKLEACDDLAATMEAASTTLSDSMQLVASDPQKALTALTLFNTSLQSAVAKVSNPEVKAQGEKAVAAIKELTDALDTMIKNPAGAKPEALTGALTKMTTELTAIGTVCG
jgi:hypothetical protein